MSDGFTKLSNNILTSSIWSESNDTRILWITLLAASNAEGYVAGTIPGLASMARLTNKETEAALEILLAPDKYSRTKDCGGRRIMTVDGGWILLNYTKYREKRDPETRRQQNRDAQARFRAKNRKPPSKQKLLISKQEKTTSAYVSPNKPKTEDRGQSKTTTALSKKTFVEFWEIYPRKASRPKALKQWLKIPKANLEKIMQAVRIQSTSEGWTKEGGKYIPYPAKWLVEEQWNNDVAPTAHPTREVDESELDGLMAEVEKNA